MSTPPTSPVIANGWSLLRRFTDARIALGRAGVSLPTAPQLAFQLAHAQARDAVHIPLDVEALHNGLLPLGLDILTLHSAAADRNTFLQRPDLGRRLSTASREQLEARSKRASASASSATAPTDQAAHRRFDVAFVIADGLSAVAIHKHAPALLQRIVPRLQADGMQVAPLAIVQQGRVAVADDIGEQLGTRLVVILIGERPGLSSPDSLGLYLTWMPKVGTTDAYRNCISNVRPEGLSYDDAAHKLHYLITQATQRQLSGVDLKEEAQPVDSQLTGTRPHNFLVLTSPESAQVAQSPRTPAAK